MNRRMNRLFDWMASRRLTRLLNSLLVLGIPVLILWGCQTVPYKIEVSHYDPAQAWAGDTFFQAHIWHPGYFAVTMNGEVMWYHPQFAVIVGVGIGLDIMQNDNVLTNLDSSPTIVNPMTDETLWQDKNVVGHHTVEATPWGNVMTLVAEQVPLDYPPWRLCQVMGDKIVEVDVNTKEVVWEWYLHDYVDPIEHHYEGMCTTGGPIGDWSHCNTVKVIQNYRLGSRVYDTALLLLSRNLDTFFLIDYPSGDLIWSCGQHGTFGRREPPLEPMFTAAHEVEMTDDGHILLYDNGTGRAIQVSRALEIAVDPQAGTAFEAWSWTDPDHQMYSPWGGDADRLPNGNTLVSNVFAGRVVEVNPLGEKVWQLDIKDPLAPPTAISYTMFMARRVPSRSWE